MMLPLIPKTLILCLGALVNGQPEDSNRTERPYVVLQKQNLVALGSVLAVLLVVMAVCVYKPLSRR